MKTDFLDETVLFQTESLYLAAALIACGYKLDGLGGDPPHHAIFLIHRGKGLDEAVQGFHTDTLSLPARRLLFELKALKDRLYEEGRYR